MNNEIVIRTNKGEYHTDSHVYGWVRGYIFPWQIRFFTHDFDNEYMYNVSIVVLCQMLMIVLYRSIMIIRFSLCVTNTLEVRNLVFNCPFMPYNILTFHQVDGKLNHSYLKLEMIIKKKIYISQFFT